MSTLVPHFNVSSHDEDGSKKRENENATRVSFFVARWELSWDGVIEVAS